MIKGTNCDCKIKDIEINGNIATITCLFYAVKETYPSVPFKFYIKDTETEEYTQVNQNTYWVDTYNGIDSSINNVSINKYKEVRLKIDITNNYKSKIKNNRWFRSFNLILSNDRIVTINNAWISEQIKIVSNVFDTPEISTLIINTEKQDDSNYKIITYFEIDDNKYYNFSYSQKNFYIELIIKSLNGYVIETVPMDTILDTTNTISTLNTYESNKKVVVELAVYDLKRNKISSISRQIKVKKNSNKLFIKTKNGIKRIESLSYYKLKNDLNISFNDFTLSSPKFDDIKVESYQIKVKNEEYNFWKTTVKSKIIFNKKDYEFYSDVYINGDHYQSSIDDRIELNIYDNDYFLENYDNPNVEVKIVYKIKISEYEYTRTEIIYIVPPLKCSKTLTCGGTITVTNKYNENKEV